MNHSNDNSFFFTRFGENIDCRNGIFMVSTWVPYGDTQEGVTNNNPPLMVQSDGVTHIPYDWKYGGVWQRVN